MPPRRSTVSSRSSPPTISARCVSSWQAVIKGVISQRLVPKADGKGRVPAVEVMLGTARIRECIDDKDKTKQMHDAIAQGFVSYGMQTFDQSLMKLYTAKLITYDEACGRAPTRMTSPSRSPASRVPPMRPGKVSKARKTTPRPSRNSLISRSS